MKATPTSAPTPRNFTMTLAKVNPLYVQKAHRKQRTEAEVVQTICWLTGYDPAELRRQIEQGTNFQTFFVQAPAPHANRTLIQGVVCGVRVENIDDPLMRQIRQLDKLVDELAKGEAMEKILRRGFGGCGGGLNARSCASRLRCKWDGGCAAIAAGGTCGPIVRSAPHCTRSIVGRERLQLAAGDATARLPQSARSGHWR